MGSPARHTRYATKGLSGGEGTNKGEKLVGCRSNRDHRCGDCCGHSAVKSGWRDVRFGHTEEGGVFLHGTRQGKTDRVTRKGVKPCMYRVSHFIPHLARRMRSSRSC